LLKILGTTRFAGTSVPLINDVMLAKFSRAVETLKKSLDVSARPPADIAVIDRPVGHPNRVGRDKRRAGDPACPREELPRAALHGVEWAAMELKDAV
jgi:hypothetical protein